MSCPHGNHPDGCERCAEIADHERAAIIADLTADVEPFVFEEYPYNSEAMGCGLEDRDITDRYEAMAYGWSAAMERAAEAIPDDLYPAHTVAARILRAAASVDVAGLMRRIDEHGARRWDTGCAESAFDKLGAKRYDNDAQEVRAALESALRMALAGR